MKYYVSLFLVFVLANVSFCQLEILWSNTYSGIQYAGLSNLILTSDESYVIAGYVQREDDINGGYCGNLVKFTDDGEIEWETILTRESLFVPSGAIETSDGGFAITGDQACFMGPPFVVRTDSEGEIVWTRTYEVQSLYDILETDDGGFIVVGGFIILKLDEAGEIVWSNQVSFENHGISIYSIINSNENGYTLLTQTSDPDNPETILIFTNSEGDSTDSWTYPGEINIRIKTIELLPDQGYLLTGSYRNEQGISIPMAVEIDFEGNITSEVMFSFEFNWYGKSSSIIKTRDGGFALGSCTDHNVDPDFLLFKTDANGEIIWQGTYSAEEREGVSHLLQNEEGDYVLAGVINSINEPSGDGWQIVKARYDSANVVNPGYSYPTNYAIHSAFPNPFNSTTTIDYNLSLGSQVSIEVYNIHGQLVDVLVDGIMSVGRHRVVWDAEDVSAGVYLVQMKNSSGNSKSLVQKVILVK
ncbi:MAG: T9SS type A sorting domain-containing protein [Calditrichaeota bacterium]|jgi:hypothetical protein|nr:T9SS type A sorting domain-containing protein [Calditrichota bacterium]MBT7790379.1 T9SS type A sorting domain-containing protein [Calditrichota bacterium]